MSKVVLKAYKDLLKNPTNTTKWMVLLGQIEDFYDSLGAEDRTEAFSKIKSNSAPIRQSKAVKYDPSKVTKSLNDWFKNPTPVKGMVFFGELEEMFDAYGGKDSTSAFSKIKMGLSKTKTSGRKTAKIKNVEETGVKQNKKATEKEAAGRKTVDMAAETIRLDDRPYSWNEFQKEVKGKKFFDPKTFDTVPFAKLDEKTKNRIWGKWNARFPMSMQQALEGRREKGIRASVKKVLLDRAAENAFQNGEVHLAASLYDYADGKIAAVGDEEKRVLKR